MLDFCDAAEVEARRFGSPLDALLAVFAGETLPPQAVLAMLVIVSGVAMVSLGDQLGRRRAS